MLRLSKKTDYALISLAYVASQTGRASSAREIAERHDIPVELRTQRPHMPHPNSQLLIRRSTGVTRASRRAEPNNAPTGASRRSARCSHP